MKKIVIASDSFKGSLSSLEVADAAESGIRRILPEAEIIKIPIADGGEGTSAILAGTMQAVRIETVVSDPLGRPVTSSFYIKEETAIIETASASGITLLSPDERNPCLTSSHGTGEQILAASELGCTKFIIGLGGSATNDGGTGMLEALGFRFFDKKGNAIEGLCGSRLAEIAETDAGQVPEKILNSEFIIACDVDTPFCGKEGATRIFGKQKGADKEMVEFLEAGMQSFAEVIRLTKGHSISSVPGSGAAGGLGGALLAFLDGKPRKGTDIILDAVGFDEAISDADLIITGEGKIDSQTQKGKAIEGILKRAEKYGTRTIAIAGIVEEPIPAEIASALTAILPIGDRPESESDLRNAMRPEIASSAIEDTVAKAMAELFPSGYLSNP